MTREVSSSCVTRLWGLVTVSPPSSIVTLEAAAGSVVSSELLPLSQELSRGHGGAHAPLRHR